MRAPHRVLGVRHRRAQLIAFFGRELAAHLVDHVGQAGRARDRRDLVGIHRFDRVDEFVAVHRLDQGLADRSR
jgi:hypothetical protein